MAGLTITLVTICLVIAAAEDKRAYTTKYDGVDIDAVIGNERLLTNYVGCLLDLKPCTPDAAELKANLPDALATNCSGCSEAQRRMSEKLTYYLIDHRPEDWALLELRYDPTGAYRERYLSAENKDKGEGKDVDEDKVE